MAAERPSAPGVMMSRTIRGGERAMIAILFATWGLVFLDRMSLLYLAPYIAPDLRLSDAQIGSLAGIIALCWALSALVFGVVSDRFGRKVVLVPMVALFSALSALSGLAHTYTQLLVFRALLGIAEGPCWTVMMTLVEENSAPAHRGRNVGIVVSAGAIIGLAAAPVLTTQIAAHFGWRWAFFIAGVPGLLLALLIGLFVRDPSRAGAAGGHRLELRELLSLLRYRNIWLSALAAAGFMTWLFLVNTFGPLYMTGVEGQSGTTAGLLMGSAGLGSFLIGLIGPSLSDRFGRGPVLAALALLSSLLPLALLMRPLYSTPAALAAILFLTQGGQAIAALCIVLIPTESVPKHLVASAVGIATMAGEIVGGFLAPVVAGVLVARRGPAEPLWVAAAGMMVVFCVALALAPVRTAAVVERVEGVG
jgi:predicted MFS family arabinose efflux permease